MSMSDLFAHFQGQGLPKYFTVKKKHRFTD